MLNASRQPLCRPGSFATPGPTSRPPPSGTGLAANQLHRSRPVPGLILAASQQIVAHLDTLYSHVRVTHDRVLLALTTALGTAHSTPRPSDALAVRQE